MKALFNDGDAARDVLAKIYSHTENFQYDAMLKQADADAYFDFGSDLNILLITDCAIGRALGLQYYLTKKTSFSNIRLCIELEQVDEYLKNAPDIIIIVGMPNQTELYKAIHKGLAPQAMIFMCDFLDAVVEAECRIQGIRYAFSTFKPIREGLLYLRQAYTEFKLNSLTACLTDGNIR